GRSVVWGERTQLSTHISKTFMRAIDSPNHFTHDALCKGSLNTACRSLLGYTDPEIGIDYANTKHLVLYGRNIFESMEVKPVRQFSKAMDKGARLTYVDPRATVTASKADRFWMIRPGTDLALNYALIRQIIQDKLYDADYVEKWVTGLDALAAFVEPYTPEWAAAETGISVPEILDFVDEISRQKPHVVFHFGYRCAGHENEIYLRRSILMLNALMGSIETPGGLFIKKGPDAVGAKPARKLTDQNLPKPSDIRFDKVGTPDFPLPDPAHGVGQMLPLAILQEDPYPIKAMFAYRFDPLMSIPDTHLTRKALDMLDLIVTIDINYSDIAWYSDVILPESMYLERLDSPQQANGLKPQIFLRQQAVGPRYDTRPGPEIIRMLAEAMGVSRYFPYETVEELVRWQLEPTGFALADFAKKGFVSYADKPLWWDRESGIKFKTPSGKIEFVSSLLENAGYPSFPAYQPPGTSRTPGAFRLVVGRCAQHTHVSTQNNLYLNELVSENPLWINRSAAEKIGIHHNQVVIVSSDRHQGEMKAKVTDFIRPECVFMLHGFGHQAAFARRSYNKGESDAAFMKNLSDPIGGSPAFHETFVQVRPLR
ncbi:MAG: molybdopterin-dependent oxidoreductase, partial [Desulfococcus multivorans]|nr:molybdopterin-dependent oxidoreductase [Desulfococcus multivorans]